MSHSCRLIQHGTRGTAGGAVRGTPCCVAHARATRIRDILREVQPGHPETYLERSQGGAILQCGRMGGGALPRLPSEQSSSAMFWIMSSVVADNDVSDLTCPDDSKVG